tara:strand:- start:3937 stop:4335 length:399 start_codon:yes stop_codon:yes gene_type:complete
MQHEVFVSEDAYLFLIECRKYNGTFSSLKKFLEKRCDEICSYLELKKGMSTMLVKRQDNVYFVYNQCLDTCAKAIPNNNYLQNNSSLGRDRNIFKPIGNVQVYLNSYISWNRISSNKVESIVEKNYKFCMWK